MAFRASGKSTLAGLFSAWLLCRDPDLRILVLAAETSLATKMVRNIKRVIEKHPLTTHLKPKIPDQWSSDRFTVERSSELRDPSVLGAGVTSNITGARADIIICDDVEVPNTSDTADKRQILRERLSETEYILVPGGTKLFIGTPHSWYTLYADEAREEIGEDKPYLEGYRRFLIPIQDEGGESAWPERYGLDEIDRMRKESGPNKFASQMMLKPTNIAEGHLDPADMLPYPDEIQYSEAQKQVQLSLAERRLVSCSAWWDPAFGHAGGDRSVLAIIYTDEEGEYWLHRLLYLKADEFDGTDEATQQCRAVAKMAAAYYLPSIALEINGLGKFLPSILRRELAKINAGTAVVEISNTRPKDIRILEAFDAVLAARALHVHESVYKTPFVTEMAEWRPGNRGGHDDGLDAVAGALSLEPVRLKRVYPSITDKGWRPGTGMHKAQTEFEV